MNIFLLALLKEISTTTGIILDTTFTLKTVKGMLCEMKTNPTRFKGHRILFIHTGLSKYIVILFLVKENYTIMFQYSVENFMCCKHVYLYT